MFLLMPCYDVVGARQMARSAQAIVFDIAHSEFEAWVQRTCATGDEKQIEEQQSKLRKLLAFLGNPGRTARHFVKILQSNPKNTREMLQFRWAVMALSQHPKGTAMFESARRAMKQAILQLHMRDSAVVDSAVATSGEDFETDL